MASDSFSHLRRQPAERNPTPFAAQLSHFPKNTIPIPPKSDDVVELPLFPLPLVLFPGAILHLQIFEFRYRMMMHTLLQTDLWFGIIYTNSASGTAEVGCMGEVIKHERLMITAVIAGLKEKNGSSRRVEGTVNIPFNLNSAGSRRRHGRPPKPQPEPVQNDVPVFVHGVQNSMATVPVSPPNMAVGWGGVGWGNMIFLSLRRTLI
ncbi:Cysteine proteinase RD21a-like [Forsythia ovata]|uniref:Cysteine proteinase RD21a-like n=1 Tax=Forsythia ovata TaxID=205694 RepID=A0ABD1QBB8_9LAMI